MTNNDYNTRAKLILIATRRGIESKIRGFDRMMPTTASGDKLSQLLQFNAWKLGYDFSETFFPNKNNPYNIP